MRSVRSTSKVLVGPIFMEGKIMNWFNKAILKAASKLQHGWRDERGVTAIEYGLIAALIAVVIIVAVTAVGTSLQEVFNTISSQLSGAVSSS